MPDACHNKTARTASQRLALGNITRLGAGPRAAVVGLMAAALTIVLVLAQPGVTVVAGPQAAASSTVVGIGETATVEVAGTPYPLTAAPATPTGLADQHLVLVGEAARVSVDWGTATPEPEMPADQVSLRLLYGEPLPLLAPDEARLAVYHSVAASGPWTPLSCAAPACIHDIDGDSFVVPLADAGYYAVAAPQVSSVTVSPNPAMPLPGAYVQFSAVVSDYAGGTVSGASLTWQALANVGTIDQSGLFHATGSIGTHPGAVTASVGPITGSATVAIQPWRLLMPISVHSWSARLIPNDPYFGTWQSSLEQTNVPLAWAGTTGRRSIVVAIIDSGIDLDHPDLAANIMAGWDYVDGDAEADDAYGHGTHVAGIVGAVGNNGIGIAGVTWSTRLMPLRVLNGQGSGEAANAASAIRWAANNGAHVINLSLGTTGYSEAMAAAIQDAIDRGCVVVAAAGNVSSSIPRGTAVYPAAYPGVIGVGAVDGNSRLASLSNSGDFIDIVAPGISIMSTYKGGSYHWMSGTSMASPHVAGVAALVWASRPWLTGAQVRAALLAGASDLGAVGWDPDYGYGLVDAYGSILAAATPRASTASERDVPAPQPTTLEPGTYNPGILWVTLEPGAGAAVLLGADASVTSMAEDLHVAGLVRITVEPGAEQETMLRLLQVPGVRAVYPDYIVFAM